MREVWAPVPGYEGLYDVSTLGSFRRSGRTRANTPELLARTISKKFGYVYVRLCKNGIAKNIRAHRLVLIAFVRFPLPGEQCRHLDGVKTNNRVDNLRWGTASENVHDKKQHGTLKGAHRGEKHHNSKLTNRQRSDIADLLATGANQYALADLYKVTQGTISRIKKATDNANATKRAEMRL